MSEAQWFTLSMFQGILIALLVYIAITLQSIEKTLVALIAEDSEAAP